MSSIAVSRPVDRARDLGGSARSVPPVRLTRRGRLVCFVAAMALALAAFVVVAGAAIGTDEAGEPLPTRTVTVQRGDTLWRIATAASPGEDPRDVIEQIHDLNSMGGTLQVGQKLHVPVHE